VLKASQSGFNDWAERLKNPSNAELRRQILSVQIREVFEESRLAHGARRIHAELTLSQRVAGL
jgi:hypothetical protein